MRLTMEQKRAVTGKLASKYRGSKSRKDRSRILDEVQELTRYNRHYAAWLLRNYGKHRIVKHEEGQTVQLVLGRKNKRRAIERPRTYDESAGTASLTLLRILARWIILGISSNKTLAGKFLYNS